MACQEPSCLASSLQSLALQVSMISSKFIGAGKTTLLNFLSGREISQNLVKTGKILANGVEKETIANFSSLSAYVQQDDILF
jgi:ABC-type multidrug transport system ATPase subunit